MAEFSAHDADADASDGTSMKRRAFLLHGVAAGLAASSWPAFAQSELSSAGPPAGIDKITLKAISIAKGEDGIFIERSGNGNFPYKLDRVFFAQTSLAIEALAGGAADGGPISGISALFLPPGAPVRQFGTIDYQSVNFKLVVPKDSRITSTADLKGKRVGYMRGGPLHILLLEALRRDGLTMNDIDAIALSSQDSVAAFLSGNLEAVTVGMYATIWQTERAGARVLVTGDDYPAFARVNFSTVAVHANTLADPLKRWALADYMRRLQKTWDWLNANQDEWAGQLSSMYSIPKEFLLKNRSRPIHPRLLPSSDGIARQRELAQILKEAGLLTRDPDIDALWDTAIEAQARA